MITQIDLKNLTKEQELIWIIWVATVIILLVFFIASTSKANNEDVSCEDNVCLYDSWMNELSQLWKEVAQAKIQKELFKKLYENEEKSYNKKLKKYNDQQAKVNWYIVSTWSQTIDQIEYNAEFLRYIDYDIPSYDSNATWFVVFNPGTSEEKSRMMNIAYQLWWRDFVLTLHAENQYRDSKKQSDCYGPSCEWPQSWLKREESYWYCQLNVEWYREFIESSYFKNPETQLIKCRNEYKKAVDNWNITTKFYWYNKRLQYQERFTFSQ